MAEEQVTEQVVTQTPTVEAEARSMGWRPQDEFEGDAARWVDANTYVDNGHKVMPILKKTNENLRNDLTRQNNEINELRAAVEASQTSMAAMEKWHTEDTKRKVEDARVKIRGELVTAKKDGNVEAEVELTEKLTQLNAASIVVEDTVAPPRRVAPKVDPTQDPEFIAWKSDNAWFGEDPIKTAIAQTLSQSLRLKGSELKGKAFLDQVTADTNKYIKQYIGGGPGNNRVAAGGGGAGGSTGGGANGKSFRDLPADAKAACATYTRDLVGANKKYKTESDWQKAYATKYFEDV